MTNREKLLWQLLDDIDTASDMFKPEQTPFYKYVMRKAQERFKYLISDGYQLYEPGTILPQRTEKHYPMVFNQGGENHEK